MDMADPLTADFPRRVVDQEEEEQAQAEALHFDEPPIVMWNSQILKHLHQGRLLVQQLVVATDHLSCHLLHHTCQLALEAGRGIIAGSILLPELDLSGNHAQPQLGDKGCYMYLVPPEAIGAGQQGPAGAASCRGHLAPAMAQLQINGGSAQPDKLGTLIVPCQYPVPPERAMLWAQEMSSSVQALLTMVLGSIPVDACRGQPDLHGVTLHHLLTSSCQAPLKLSASTPLPIGSLVSGLPAAIMTVLEAQNQDGAAIIQVDTGEASTQQKLAAITTTVLQLVADAQLCKEFQQASQRASETSGAKSKHFTGLLYI